MALVSALKQKTTPFLQLMGNLLFPPRCVACQTETDAAHSFCVTCFQELKLINAPLCKQCGLPFEYGLEGELLCNHCLLDPPPYDVARAGLVYDEASRKLVTRLKYADQTELVPVLAGQLWRAGASLLMSCDWLIPVPLHPKRMRARQFNQSALLAYALQSYAQIPVLPDGMVRVKDTPPQASLSREERIANVRDAFAVNSKYSLQLTGSRVALIDDVITTGATIHACTQALKQAGVSHITVLTVAKNVQHD